MELKRHLVRIAGVPLLGVLLFSGAGLTPAEGSDRRVRICNHASSRIIHVFATHTYRRDWGKDLLRGAIWPGGCRIIDPGYSGGYCVLDWRLETKDGRHLQKRLDACKAENWHIHN